MSEKTQQSNERSHDGNTYTLQGDFTYIAIDPRVMSHNKVQVPTTFLKDDQPREHNFQTFANIETQGGRQYMVVGSPEGLFGVLEQCDDTLVSRGPIGRFGVSLEDVSGNTVVKVAPKPQYDDITRAMRNVIEIEKQHEDTKSTVSVEIPQGIIARSGSYSAEQLTKERRRKVRKMSKFFTAVALGYTIFHSGGAVDAALDGLNRAHDTVYEAVEPAALDTSADRSADAMTQADVDRANQARENVARTMDDLDGHRYGDIRERAQKFLAAHPNEVMSQDAIQHIFDHLDNAETIEEIKESLEPFEEFYGFDFIIPDDGELRVNIVKRTVGEICKAMMRLPKHLVHETADLKDVRIADRRTDSENKGVVQAYYTRSQREITVYAANAIVENLYKINSNLSPGSENGSSLQSIFLHELGHALAMNEDTLDVPDKGMVKKGNTSVVDDGADLKYVARIGEDIVRGGILKRPNTISTYSRENSDENIAENIAGVIDTTLSQGISHPDETREYTSRSNKTMIKVLVKFEQIMPGLADYLVSTDGRLMDRQLIMH